MYITTYSNAGRVACAWAGGAGNIWQGVKLLHDQDYCTFEVKCVCIITIKHARKTLQFAEFFFWFVI